MGGRKGALNRTPLYMGTPRQMELKGKPKGLFRQVRRWFCPPVYPVAWSLPRLPPAPGTHGNSLGHGNSLTQ